MVASADALVQQNSYLGLLCVVQYNMLLFFFFFLTQFCVLYVWLFCVAWIPMGMLITGVIDSNRYHPAQLALMLADWIDRVLVQEDSLGCSSVMHWMLKAVFISHSERDVQEQLSLPLYAFYSTCLNGHCRQVLSVGEKREATRRWSVSLHTPDRL